MRQWSRWEHSSEREDKILVMAHGKWWEVLREDTSAHNHPVRQLALLLPLLGEQMQVARMTPPGSWAGTWTHLQAHAVSTRPEIRAISEAVS